MAFRGTFEYNLDDKNRLVIPTKFRDDFQGGIVLAKGLEQCVALWRCDDYDTYVAQSFENLNPMSPEARQLKRFFAANALDAELDNTGRVKLPPFLMEHAGLEREAVITGAMECLEVWDKSTWSAYNEDLSARASEITAMLPGQGGGS